MSAATFAAVASGNTVLLKPSDNTPIIAAELVRLRIDAGLPSGVSNLVTGRGPEVGKRLIASPRIDLIAFTGSREVGLHIWEAAGGTPPGQPSVGVAIRSYPCRQPRLGGRCRDRQDGGRSRDGSPRPNRTRKDRARRLAARDRRGLARAAFARRQGRSAAALSRWRWQRRRHRPASGLLTPEREQRRSVEAG